MARKKRNRDDELSGAPKFDEELLKITEGVEKGFKDQNERANETADNWDMYNLILGERQFYNGESKIYLPYVRDAVEARVTRFVNQLFPQSGRNVEVTSTEADLPQALTALLEAYVRKTKLRTQIIPALLRNGDCEGQYSLYVNWAKRTRHTIWKVKKPVQTGGMDNAAAGEVDDIEEEEVIDALPEVEVIPDSDLLVLPATVDSIEEALDVGGSVTVLRRWTKGKLKAMVKRGDIRDDEAEDLMTAMDDAAAKNDKKDTEKDNARAAGIRGRGKHVLIYETWAMVKVGAGKDADRVLCRIYFAGDKRILGCKQNPFWNDRCPVISAPVEKVAGVFKGKAPVSTVADLQIFANDTINEGADTAHFSAMPIVMTDPEKNPRVGSMVLGLAAVWETNPNDTQFVQFPELWASAMDRAKAIQQQIFQSLGVNPSMIPQSTGGKGKRNQAEMATEQQVDLLTTADAVTVLEEGIMTPLVQWFAELDHQFRDDEVLIRSYGDMGLRVTMETVEPSQLNNRYEFRWFGVESNRNAQQIQQQISGLNILTKLPKELYPGYKMTVAPIIVQLVENTFGPRLGAMIFAREDLYSVDPQTENDMMAHGFIVEVHPGDDDMAHMQAHIEAMQHFGDPHNTIRAHLMLHQKQMMQKAQAQQAGGGGAPGGPGPAGHGAPPPGGPGGPPAGAQVGDQHAPKAPPGSVHPDRMAAAGAVTMPRKM